MRRKSRIRAAFRPHGLVLRVGPTSRRVGEGRSLVAADGLVDKLRAVKDRLEIDRIRDAARIGSEVMEETIRLVRPGVSELDLAAEIGYRMRRKGLPGVIRSDRGCGPRSALPHARPTARQIGRNELVVLDLGAILRRYCSDLTRTCTLAGRLPEFADGTRLYWKRRLPRGRCEAWRGHRRGGCRARGLLQRKAWALLCP